MKRAALYVLSMMPCAAFADPIVRDFAVSLGLGASDNIGGLYVNQISDTVASAGVEANLKRETRRLALSLASDVQYISYLEGTFDDELAGTASLEGKVFLIEDKLSWVLRDNWGQTQVAPFAPVTPENRQDINVVSTGPELRWDISGGWSMLASGLVMRETNERTGFDNDRRFGQLGLIHRSSRDSSIALLANTQRVDFVDDLSASDFDRHEALLRYQLGTSRTTALVDVGRTELRENGMSQGRWLSRLEVERRITRRMKLRLTAGQVPSDTGTLFSGAEAAVDRSGVGLGGGAQLPAIGNGGVISVADSLENQFGSLGWRLDTSRIVATASVEYRRERYASRSEFDRTVRAARLGVARDLSSTLQISIEASDFVSRSRDEGTELLDTSLQVSGRWRVSSQTSLDVSAEYFVRGSSSTGGGFDDSRLWMRLRYAPLTDRPTLGD